MWRNQDDHWDVTLDFNLYGTAPWTDIHHQLFIYLFYLSYLNHYLTHWWLIMTFVTKKYGYNFLTLEQLHTFYASAFRRRRHYVFGLSVRPSVRPKPEIPSFDLYIGPLVHPTNRYRFTACPSVRPSVRLSVRPSVCPSVRPERFPGICRRLHGGISLKFYMLMYLDHLQNWFVYGHGLVIFLILALFGLSETGQIWGFRVFPGECMKKMTWNFARWCILTTFRTD